MGPHDEETERYLKEFQPRAIRELKVSPERKTPLWKRLAAAAAIVACAEGVLWFTHRGSAPPKRAARIQPANVSAGIQRRPQSTIALTRLALDDGNKLDALLDEESRRSLPNVQEEHGALRVLAKD